MKKVFTTLMTLVMSIILGCSITTAVKAESSSSEDETYLVITEIKYYQGEEMFFTEAYEIEVGEERQMYAMFVKDVDDLQDPYIVDEHLPAIWSCNDTEIAVIDARTGIITGKKVGTVTISAVYQGKTVDYEMKVVPAKPTMEELSGICFFRYIPGPVFTMKSPTGSLSIDTTGIIPEMEAKNIEFYVENEDIATISSTEYSDVGIKYVNLVFKRAGSTKVHASLAYKGKVYEDAYDLWVYDSEYSLDISPKEASMEVGETLEIKAYCMKKGSGMAPWDLNSKDFELESSSNIAKIENGKVIAIGKGTTVITATFKVDDEVVSDYCTIFISSKVDEASSTKEPESSKVEESSTKEQESSKAEETKTSEPVSSTVEESKPREHESSTVEESKPREHESSKVGENSAKEQESSKAEKTKTSEHESSTVEESKPREHESSKVEETSTKEQESSTAVESKASEHESSTVEESNPSESESSTVEVFKTSESELTVIILSEIIVAIAIIAAIIIVKVARKR